MRKRTFSAEFKTNIVLELLKGEKQVNELAAEHSIAPNQIRNWKNEFLNNAPLAFDDKREAGIKEKLSDARKEKEEYAKKVGELTMQVDWLKKKSEELLGPEWEGRFSKKPFDF
jgi:transposase-like protein